MQKTPSIKSLSHRTVFDQKKEAMSLLFLCAYSKLQDLPSIVGRDFSFSARFNKHSKTQLQGQRLLTRLFSPETLVECFTK